MAVTVVPGACPLCGPGFPRVDAAHGPDFHHPAAGAQEFRLARCTGCGILVLDPRPADDEIAGLYPPDYISYSFEQLNPIMRWGRDTVQRGKTSLVGRLVPAGGTVVDVGCGDGALLRLLRRRYGSRFRLVGWDYPGRHLDGLAGAGIDVVAAAIEAVHAPRGVDMFILNQVIEHVPYPDRLLRMLADALAPGGYIAIETPDTDSVDARLFAGRYWGGYHFPRHMVLFDQTNLRTLVERCGLHVVQSAHLASPAFWVQSLHHAASESRLASLSRFCTLDNVPLVSWFSVLDLLASPFIGTSNQRLVVRRPL